MIYSGIFVVWSFNDCINWASLLAISAVNAFCHIDIISGCSSRSIRSRLTFDSYSSSRACSSTELTCYASLFAGGISSKSMFSSEFWRKWPFFVRISNSPLRLECVQNSTIEKGIEKLWPDYLNVN